MLANEEEDGPPPTPLPPLAERAKLELVGVRGAGVILGVPPCEPRPAPCPVLVAPVVDDCEKPAWAEVAAEEEEDEERIMEAGAEGGVKTASLESAEPPLKVATDDEAVAPLAEAAACKASDAKCLRRATR